MFFNLNAIKDYRKSQKRMADILNEATMTNTPMSEREKELVPLVREALGALRDGTNWSLANDLEKALRAYDPKPEPVPVIPAWEEFIAFYRGFGKAKAGDSSVIATDLDTGIANWIRISSGHEITRPIYEAIRQATSKAPTE